MRLYLMPKNSRTLSGCYFLAKMAGTSDAFHGDGNIDDIVRSSLHSCSKRY